MANFLLNEPFFSEPNEACVLLTLENSITSRVLRRYDAMSNEAGEEVFDSLNEYELLAMRTIVDLRAFGY